VYSGHSRVGIVINLKMWIDCGFVGEYVLRLGLWRVEYCLQETPCR
jgi:hypothetical protein